MPRTKVDHFVSFLNFDNECNFFKRSSVQMTAIQLDTLLTELETAVEIPDLVPRAVSIVRRTSTQQMKKSGPLNVIYLLMPEAA